MAAADANVQRQVNLTCSLRLVRLGNMANLNLDQIGLNIPNFESDLEEGFGSFIMETLTAQDNPDLPIDENFIMRPHSDINVVVQRAVPDGNLFNVQATFTVKYNNEDFWDYDDRFMDRDVGILQDAFIDYSSRPQHVNDIGFLREVEDIDIRMSDEEQFVPLVNPQMVGGVRHSRRRRITRSKRSSRRITRSKRSSRRITRSKRSSRRITRSKFRQHRGRKN